MLRVNYNSYIITEGVLSPTLKLGYFDVLSNWPMMIVARPAIDVFFFVQPDCTTYKTDDGCSYIYVYRG